MNVLQVRADAGIIERALAHVIRGSHPRMIFLRPGVGPRPRPCVHAAPYLFHTGHVTVFEIQVVHDGAAARA